MFSVNIRGVKCGVTFSFFAVLALIFLCQSASLEKIAVTLMSCFFHECGHLFFMFLFGRKPESIVAYGGGIRITPRSNVQGGMRQDIIILLAGCGVNFICAGVWYALFGFGFFCRVNLLLGIFNLLPFKYFDGGRVLDELFTGRALDIVRAVFVALVAVCVIQMALGGILSVSFLLTFVFIAVSELLW